MSATHRAQSKVRNLRHLKRDTAYRWSDRDEKVSEISNLITDSGLETSEIADLCSDNNKPISRNTVYRIQSERTRRPYNTTLDAIADALGMYRPFVPKSLEPAVNKLIRQKRHN